METTHTEPEKHEELKGHHELADELFMTAPDLRKYMREMQIARASKSFEGMDRAEKARQDLIKQLSEPLDLSPEHLREILLPFKAKIRAAAERGESQMMVVRFPNAMCTDGGRAINNSEPGWPDTLTGRPRQAYEIWRDHLSSAGFGLSAMIIDWPGGLPGDVGLFLRWGDPNQET